MAEEGHLTHMAHLELATEGVEMEMVDLQIAMVLQAQVRMEMAGHHLVMALLVRDQEMGLTETDHLPVMDHQAPVKVMVITAIDLLLHMEHQGKTAEDQVDKLLLVLMERQDLEGKMEKDHLQAMDHLDLDSHRPHIYHPDRDNAMVVDKVVEEETATATAKMATTINLEEEDKMDIQMEEARTGIRMEVVKTDTRTEDEVVMMVAMW